MSLIPQLVPIELSNEKQKNIVLENIVKMLIGRKLIQTENLKKYVDDIINNIKDDNTYDVQTDNGMYRIVLLLDQKISSITKSSVIGAHLDDSSHTHNIIIVSGITPRAMLTIQNNYSFVEVFLKKEMMFNIVDHIYVPRHILLSQEEGNNVLLEYGAQKKDLPRIFISDPISRYYNAKIGQIFRIIRPSQTTGDVNFYRLVCREISAKKK